MVSGNICCFLKLVINERSNQYQWRCKINKTWPSLGATVRYFTTRLLNGIRKPEKIKPYKVSSIQSVPSHIIRPSYVGSVSNPATVKDPEVHDATGIYHMQNAGRLAASVLEYARSFVKPGITTDEIDKAVHKMIIGAGAYPSPLGYKGFPKSICTSVNEVAFHGIPDSRSLEDGDIINIDVTIYLNGYHADTSKTFLCGNVNNNARQLVEVTEECLEKAISVCGPGVEFKELGKIFIDIAGKYGYSVDTSYAGHGVGKHFHSAPCINFCDDQVGCMMVGQTFALGLMNGIFISLTVFLRDSYGYAEPLLSLGSIEYELWDDNFTVVTADGSLSAQFEHTLLITNTSVDILTKLG